MIDDKTLEKLKTASIEERIVIIEGILKSLKSDIKKVAIPQAETVAGSQRPAFGFMSGTGKILGELVAPILPENTWEVLR